MGTRGRHRAVRSRRAVPISAIGAMALIGGMLVVAALSFSLSPLARAGSSPCSAIAEGRVPSLGSSRPTHVVFSLSTSYGSTYATTHLCTRRAGGTYQQSWQVASRVGYAGFAAPGRKVEGDGKTPSGAFPIRGSFGAANPGTSLRYRVLNSRSCWGGTRSIPKEYNRYFLSGTPGRCHGPGDEHLADWVKAQYRQALEIGYNDAPVVVGKGSAIFFHVNGKGATAGCVSAPAEHVTRLIRTVHPNDHIVMGVASALITPPKPSPTPPPGSENVKRVAGADRYETAARVSSLFSPGVEVAYVASGVTFPDALAAAPLAARSKSPVLLAPSKGLPGSVTSELRRLKPRRIVVVGGPSRIPASTVRELGAYTSGEVSRVAGADRYETAAMVSSQFGSGAEVAYVASGATFPDALSGAALAGRTGGPVVLVPDDSVPESVAAELSRLAPKRIVVLGGRTSAGVRAQLARFASSGSVEVIAGRDRFETSARIAARFPTGLSRVGVVTGLDYPDALAAAALMGRDGTPLVLVKRTSIPSPVGYRLGRLRMSRVIVIGGESSVSTTVQYSLAQYVR